MLLLSESVKVVLSVLIWAHLIPVSVGAKESVVIAEIRLEFGVVAVGSAGRRVFSWYEMTISHQVSSLVGPQLKSDKKKSPLSNC